MEIPCRKDLGSADDLCRSAEDGQAGETRGNARYKLELLLRRCLADRRFRVHFSLPVMWHMRVLMQQAGQHGDEPGMIVIVPVLAVVRVVMLHPMTMVVMRHPVVAMRHQEDTQQDKCDYGLLALHQQLR